MSTRIIATTLSSLLFSTAVMSGCVVNEADPVDETPNNPENPQNPDDNIDQALLAEYRAALPGSGQLMADAPESSSFSAAAVGDPAFYPTASHDIVIGINGAVSGIITVLEEVTALPPTVFNSDTKEFVWGPFPNDDGVGYVGAYIRDAGPDADFRFEYAFLRGVDNDLANLAPVIWGGATPDENNEDHGVGVTLWDFEASRDFELAHNPNADELILDRGRFVALYAAGYDEEDPNAEVAFVLASFRDFIPADNAEADAADLDYFYGRVEGDNLTFDFIDWEANFDIDEPGDGLAEDVGVRMAFINEGAGRAEADVAGGSLADGEEAAVTECWNAGLSQNYLSFEYFADGVSSEFAEEGNFDDCGVFTASLSELGVPSLDDVDAELRAALDEAARNGIPAE